MEYLDFEIRIANGENADYSLAVIHSPAGQTRTIRPALQSVPT